MDIAQLIREGRDLEQTLVNGDVRKLHVLQETVRAIIRREREHQARRDLQGVVHEEKIQVHTQRVELPDGRTVTKAYLHIPGEEGKGPYAYVGSYTHLGEVVPRNRT